MISRRPLAILAGAVLLAGAAPAAVSAHEGGGRAGTVYTLTNEATGNAVQAYSRAADGSLSWFATYPTGGLGTGAGLGSEGAVALSPDGAWLLAVDAGSNDVAAFRVRDDGSLRLVERANAHGTMPISVTIHERLAYVLDAGGAGNIAGFRLDGGLRPVPGSVRSLSGSATGPAQIAFRPDGSVLVVTEKATSTIDTFRVGNDGAAGPATTFASAGSTPFGFAFDGRGRIFVSEAAASALSSYRVARSGALRVVSASVVDGGLAACWVAVNREGTLAFVANAHNGTISTYAIAPNGSVTVEQPVATALGAGSAPLDEAVSPGGHALFVVDSGKHTLDAFQVRPDGSLAALGGAASLPASDIGLAVR